MESAVAVSKIVTFGLYREFKRLSLRFGEVSLFLQQDFAESPCRRRYMGGLCSNAELIQNRLILWHDLQLRTDVLY